MFLPIQFEFSSDVTSAELTNSFIDTKSLDVVEIAQTLTEAAFHGTAAEGIAIFQTWGFSKEHSKIWSLLCKPYDSLDIDGKLCDKVFYEDDDINFEHGFRNYVAILSRAINSAPGDDSLWPYGRYFLSDIDGNVGAKLINIGLHWNYMQNNFDGKSEEITWKKIIEFHHLNENLRSFGLLLCNFKDQLNEDHGPWYGLFENLSQLARSDDPTVDKVAIRQTAFQIVSKYIALRKNGSDHEKLADDIQIFKISFYNCEEIQKIRLTDLALDLSPQYEWKKVCQVLGNLGIPELNLPSSITTTIVEDRSYTPHFDEQGCFNSIAGYSLEMGVRNRDARLHESDFMGIDLAAYLEGQPDEDFFCYSEHGNGYSSFAGFVVRTKGLLISHQFGLGSNISVHPFNAQTIDAFNKYLTPHLHEEPESIFDHVIVLYSEYREDFWILSTDPSSWDPNKPDDYERLRIPEKYGLVGRWNTHHEFETYNPRSLEDFFSPIYAPRLQAAAKYLDECLRYCLDMSFIGDD